jgi:hypothetical protein
MFTDAAGLQPCGTLDVVRHGDRREVALARDPGGGTVRIVAGGDSGRPRGGERLVVLAAAAAECAAQRLLGRAGQAVAAGHNLWQRGRVVHTDGG